ncbi:MAG: 50S ribosomal protein L29 [Solirubrobacterales bacterium]
MKAKEIRELDDHQLIDKLRGFREELFNLRFRNSTGELENTTRLREARRSTARVLTFAKQRGLDVEKELRKH